MDAMEFEDNEVLILYEEPIPVGRNIEIKSEVLQPDEFYPMEVEDPMILGCVSEETTGVELCNQSHPSFAETSEPELAVSASTTLRSPALPCSPAAVPCNQFHTTLPEYVEPELTVSASNTLESSAFPCNTVAEPCTPFEEVFTGLLETQIPSSTCLDTASLPHDPLDFLPGQTSSEVKLEDSKINLENASLTSNVKNVKHASFLQMNSELLKPLTTTSTIVDKKCYNKTIPKQNRKFKNFTIKPGHRRAQYYDKSHATSILNRTNYCKPKPFSLTLRRVEEWYNGPYTLPPDVLQVLNFKCYEKHDNEIQISCVTSLSAESVKLNECEYCLQKVSSSLDHEHHNSDSFTEEFVNLIPEKNIVSSTSCDEQVIKLNAEQIDFLDNISDTDLANNGPLKVFYCKSCQLPFDSLDYLTQHCQKFHVEMLCKMIQKYNWEPSLYATEEIQSSVVASPETQDVQAKQGILQNTCSEKILVKPDIKCEPCPICNFQAYSRYHLEFHMKTHWKQEELKTNVGFYSVPIKQKEDEIWYLCELCQITFDTHQLLCDHVKSHGAKVSKTNTFVRRYMCTICSKVYRGDHSFNNHVVCAHLPLLGCRLPKRIVYVFENLTDTSLAAQYRPKDMLLRFSCKVCGFNLGSKKQAMDHMLRVHCESS